MLAEKWKMFHLLKLLLIRSCFSISLCVNIFALSFKEVAAHQWRITRTSWKLAGSGGASSYKVRGTNSLLCFSTPDVVHCPEIQCCQLSCCNSCIRMCARAFKLTGLIPLCGAYDIINWKFINLGIKTVFNICKVVCSFVEVVCNFTVIIFEWLLLSVWTTFCWSHKWHNYYFFKG